MTNVQTLAQEHLSGAHSAVSAEGCGSCRARDRERLQWAAFVATLDAMASGESSPERQRFDAAFGTRP